jgi:hypothetical protein
VIVYGMAEDGHIPTAISPINALEFSKEWLENIIISNVQPRIDGLHINPVQLADSGVAYAITVPQSYTAHQAADKRYYKRFNFQSVPMEHYEVQAAMNRAKTPIVDVLIESHCESRTAELHRYSLKVLLHNKGAVTAKNMKLIIGIPAMLKAETSGFHAAGTSSWFAGGMDHVIRTNTRRLIDTYLFPQDVMVLGHVGAGCSFEIDDQRFDLIDRFAPKIDWIIYADDMARREGSVPVAELIDF